MKPKPPTLTPAQKALLAKRLRARGDKGEDLELAPLARDGRDGPFPLSSGQERLWFVDQYAPGTSTYNVPHGVRWRGPLDAGALERALHALVTRHEGLRARFVVEDGGPVQRIAPPDAWRLARADASDLAEATRLANAEAARPFDLSRDLLFRATLLRLGAEDHLLVLVVHHAVTDGWSIRILHRELITLYAAFAAGQPSPLAPLRLTYVDYAAWQRRLLASTHHDGELAYWKRALADAPTLELPTDHPRPPQQTFRGATHVLELPLATSRGLAALARAERVTLPIALLGTLAAVLARHTGQRDVVIGAPAANRTRLELEPLVGFFVNMLAIRIELGERPTTRSLFRITRDRMLEAQEHEKVPFDRVVEHVRPARDRSRHPVFQVAFRVNEPVDAPALPGVQLSSFAFELTVALYDLVLSIDVAGEHVRCTFDFNADLYDGATIERLAAHLGALLAAMIAEPDRDLDELSLAGPDDRDAPVTAPDGARGYVLDAAAHPCPIGVVGELYVEGPGGARVRTHTRARRRPDGGLDVLAAVTPSEPRRASAPAAAEPVAYVAPGDPTEVALAELWQTLLGVERVGVHDDFFALGGHSLLAARFVARLRALLGVELPVRALFDAPTIARIAATIAALRAERVAASAPPLTAAPRTARPPLSFAQRRLWFLHQLEPDGASYLVAHARRYDDLDVARLRGAFEALIARHEILRTSFPAVDGEPYQHVHAPAPFALPVDDARALAAGDREALLVRTAAAQRRPFDLAAAPPLRARLIQVGPTTHVLFVTLHHILTDGGSIDVFWRELWACYDGVAAPPLPVQYADFAAWQRAWLTGDELARQLAFWTERLRGAPEETELPFKGPRPPRQTYGGREHVVTLDDARTATLRDLARRHGATLFMALAAAFRALLVRYTGQLDVVLGTAIDNRSVAELDGLVGMFANTLALRNALSPDDTFATVLAREKAGTLAALDHQHTPFELVVDALGVPRSLSRPPVFQVVYVHQGDAGAEERGAAQPTGQPPTAEFDLTLISWDHRDRLALHFLYNDDLFDGALIEQLGRHLVRLLDEVARAADRPLAALALLDDDARARLRAWGTASTPDEAPHVLELVARQVAAAPDAIAVEHAGTRLTYRALAERAERVAGWLAHRGVTRGDHVAICVERSADMVAALLGVLQVGAAYVPIDPEYPAARRELLRRDTGAVLELDDDALAAAVAWGAAGPHVAAGGDDVAYVIYTSGSTGTPKGVRVPHRSVANYLAAMRGPHGVTAASTVGAIASLSFDAHVIDLLLPLANGARCVIADRDTTRDGERLAALLDERGVDFMFATPSTWRALLATGWRPSRRFRVHAGGEAVPADLAATLLAHAESVWNGYGPTETTVYVSCTALAAGRPVTIGRPLAGLRAYVLDDARRMVPVGVAGELYVGGAGVALGYHARPALTAERFVVDAFAEHPGARMYRTGDRVRWTRDGQLEYLGRVDTQIKLRGLRIELGEIEAALRAMPDIDDVAVVLREDTPGAAQLVAYLATSAPLDDATIRGALRATLPDYMVPSAFVALPALPLNANGKLDRRALPLPDLAARAAYVAPRDAIETAIAATWRDILDVERVGAYDDFFALGGHSLLATRVTSRLRTELGVALPVRALFEAPTVADLAAHVAAARDAATPAPLALRPPPRAAHPPLSYAQQRLWFLQQLEPTSTAYVITRARRVPAVDVALLGRAFDEVRARHEILRTSFPAIGGAPYQRVHASAPWTITVEDARAEDAAAVLARVEAEHQRPFDLGAAPPLRTHLVRVAGDTDVLFVTLHHILTDGWSEDVMWRELWAAYDALAAGGAVALPALPVQYADYAAWQRAWLHGDELARQLAFWTTSLAGAPEELALPRMGVRPPRQTFAGRAVAVELDAALGARLRAFARAEGVTLFMLFAAALRAVLARYAGQADVVLGTAIANRDAHELEGLIGMFVNTLALRNELRAGDTFRALLAREKQLVLAAFEHQHTPFELVVDALGVERSPSRTPVFQVMYVHQEAAGEARGQELELAGRTAMFDLAVDSWDRGDRLGVDLVYNTDLFEPALIEQLARHYQRVLDLVTHAPQQRLATLALLAPDEERRALESVTPDLSAGPLIPSLIEAQVDRAPDAAAVTFEGVSLTYRELDARVNRLAHQLLAAGARHDQPIAVCLERSLDLIVAVLAVVKAGAPYLPIDPHAPPRRIRTMLDDSACTLVVDRAWLDAMRDEIAARPPARPAVALDGDHAAYVLFTSGSTGTPKGAVISHASLRNRLVWAHALGFTARDVLLHKTPITFDVSVFELFYPFVIGAHLVVARPDGHRDPAYLTRLIRDQGVTYAHFVPSMFGPFLDAARTAPCPSLRRVICSGEALPAALVRDAAAVLDAELYNLYGPTEATVDVTWWRCGTGARSSTPIGSPVAGVRCYVLDDALQLVPPGVAGELYLAGVQLARGYIGRPTLTSERFVPDPFVPGARMYRTGDLARALPDGALDYLGRTDHQVKLRGFRIELGEIEATLRGDARVRDAAVILREDVPGNPRLVAYVVPAATDLDVSALGAALATTLPDYMVPSAFVAMPGLPMTSSGKLDRKALPAPDLTSAEAYVAPRTPTEEALAAIWRGLLAVETVGAHDDFFALGGHSLLAIRVIAQLRDQLGVELPVRAMFEAPRLEDLAARIAALRGTQGGTPALVAGARAARPPLSFAQERLWFLHQLDPDSAAYAIGYARRYDDLDVEAMRRALAALVDRHEILRTTFPTVDGEPYQRVHAAARWDLPVVDASTLDRDAQTALLVRIEAELRRPFDLANGPLVRARAVALGGGAHALFLTLHHIVTDGGSSDILWRELWAYYDAAVRGAPAPALPALPVQYADFAAWQRTWLSGAELDRQLAFWTDTLRGAPEETPLPFKGPRPPRQTFTGRAQTVTLDAARTAAVRAIAARHGATLFMTMAAAFRALLVRYTGQPDIVLGTAITNRTAAALEGLVGMFANSLALRTEVRADDTFATLLAREKAGALAAYDHQHTPFELIVDALGVERSLSRSPIVQVMYIHQGESLASERGTPLHIDGAVTAEIDAVLQSWESGGELVLQLTYNDDLFEPALVAQLLRHLLGLVTAVTADPSRPLAAIDLLDADDHARLDRWNATERDFDAPALMHALVERHAETKPDHVALEHAGVQLTYRELAARSRRVAGWLAARGVKRGDRVALCVERSVDMVAAILGVLRLGAAYVPIDPEYPVRRREHMRVDAGAVLEVTDEMLREAVVSTSPAPDVRVDPEDIAYVIYTSGSTGLPKGVMLPHRAVANFLLSMVRSPGVRPDDVALALLSISFDGSVLDIFVPLAGGATLVIASRELGRDGLQLARFIDARGVTFLPATSSTWRMLVSTDWRPSKRLRIIAGAERVPDDLVELLATHAESVWNLYGPTETAVGSTLTQLHAGRRVTVGRPIDNTTTYILDEARQLAPIGVPGELYIGGRGVARGYNQRPDLTAERFVADPFATGDARMYRTGDLARWTLDGELEYLGRIDAQIKLRGFRIELGEIEAALRTCAGVEDAAVLVREDTPGSPQLVGYVVSTRADLDVPALEAELGTSVPTYMVPSAFVVLAAFPLNPNGKLDRNALPAPERSADAAYVAPRDATEEAIAAIWRTVLRVERVGIHDDFFSLGGHSLLATRVISQIRTQLAVELPVRAMFESPTVAGLAAHLARPSRGDVAARPLAPPPRGERPPLSFAQERLWFLHYLEPDSAAYVVSETRKFAHLEVPALEQAFTALVARHENLRTSFPDVDGQPYQLVHPAAPWSIQVHDRASVASIEAEHHRGFDLRTGPLLRTSVVRQPDGSSVLIVTLHHIITDGWSQDLLWRELWRSYEAIAAGRPAPALPAVPIQFADYAAWQRSWLSGAELDRQLAYWTAQLQGAPEETALPLKGPRPAHQDARRVERVDTSVPAGVADQLRTLAKREGATLFMVLLAAFRALLARATGQTDLVIGTPIANRNHGELEELIGFFVNTLALRGEVTPGEAFTSLLAREKATALAAYDHQDAPFELIVDALHVERRLDLTPVFQVWFVHQNTPREASAHGEYVAPADARTASKFDLAFYSLEDGESIYCAWQYNAELLDASTIAQLLADYQALLAEVAARPDVRLDALLPASDTAVPHRTHAATLWERFRAIADARPSHVAVHDRDRRWTYGELRDRADAIGALLDDADAGERVACALAHGGEMIAGVLGVLASGRAYVPLDPTHPIDRSSFVLDDSGARTLLCDAETAAFAASFGDVRVVRTDAAPGDRRPSRRPQPHDLAYCLYTSGSTGRPKGVLQRHAHVVDLLDAYRERLAITPDDVVTLLSTFAFDAAVVDVFSTLLAGATLCTYELRARGLADLPHVLAAHGVTIYHSTPTVWRELVALAPSLSPAIRAVVLGGEEVVPADVELARAACAPSTVVVNGYGMTECSWALLNVVRAGDALDRPTVALGAPLDGVRVTLRTPLGPQRITYGVGTICIESPSVALGYHARPDETAVAFPAPGTYLTSDRGRLLPDGRIEFAGRHAHQVKLRGFRIDLREIEAVLAAHPAVAKAAAAVHASPRGPELVGYVVARDDDPATDTAALREHLAAQLPDYMVPAVIVTLPVMPLGPTGKLDRNALPAPDAAAFAQDGYVAPRDAIEQTLAEIWCELLGVERVGVHDDFFDLGGHSLLAMRVLAHIRRRLDVDLSVRVFFEAPTIEGIAHELAPAVATPAAASVPLAATPRGERPRLSFSQERLWFLQQLEPDSAAYVIDDARRYDQLDVEALRRAVEALVARHEILRTTFPAVAGVPFQRIHPPPAWSIAVEDARTADAAAQADVIARVRAHQARPFDLATGPLVRTDLVRITDDAYVFVVTLHHIITDGWSQEVLWRDLTAYYDAFVAGRAPTLPALALQYADYAAWQRAWLTGDELARQLAFWTGRLRGAPEETALPLKGPRVTTARARHIATRIEPDVATALHALAQREGATLYMVLLAGARALLARLTGQGDIVIGTPIANREQRELEDLVGFFVNTLAIRTELSPDDPFTTVLAREREAALAAFDHQATPFELVVDALHLERRADLTPLFQVWFVHQNMHFQAPVEDASSVESTGLESASKFDLALYTMEVGGAIRFTCVYNADLFDDSTIEQIVADYRALLAEVATHPTLTLAELLSS